MTDALTESNGPAQQGPRGEAIGASEAREVRWMLPASPAPFGCSSAELAAFLEEVSREVTQLQDSYQGRVSSLDATGLSNVLTEVAAHRDAIARAEQYVQLRLGQAPSDSQAHALREVVRKAVRPIRSKLSFLALEWTSLPEEAVERLLSTAELSPYRTYLGALRAFQPYVLSASEEDILRRKSLSSRQYWKDLFHDHSARIYVTVGEGGSTSLNRAIAHLSDPDRSIRQRWWLAIVAALQVEVDVRAAAVRALIADKAADDVIRKYPSWITARRLASGLTEELLENTIATSQLSLPIAHRYYACRRAALGVAQLYPWDLEPIAETGPDEIPWRQARDVVEETFDRLSSAFRQPLGDILDGHCVDAEVRPGKQPTGFTSLGTPSTRPYISVNYIGRRRDVLGLAHELAHAVHARLSAGQSMLCFRPPTLLTEAFASLVEIQATHVLSEMVGNENGPLDLAMMCLEGCTTNLWYPAANHVFEAEAHRLFRDGSPTDVKVLADLWHQTRRLLYGDTVQEIDENRWWWSRLPHWTAPAGYWFGYCFGHLLALHLWRLGQESRERLSSVLADVLSTGSSISLLEQLQIVGVGVSDAAVWQGSLETMEAWAAEAELLLSIPRKEQRA